MQKVVEGEPQATAVGDIKRGDSVLAMNRETGELTYDKVIVVFDHAKLFPRGNEFERQMVFTEISIKEPTGGQERQIKLTRDHKLYLRAQDSADYDLVCSSEARVGDHLQVVVDGAPIEGQVTSVSEISHGEETARYFLTLEHLPIVDSVVQSSLITWWDKWPNLRAILTTSAKWTPTAYYKVMEHAEGWIYVLW